MAAVVGSYDANFCYYTTSIRVQQKSKEEIILDFDKMMGEVLKVYLEENKHMPTNIIFYRDGVSEGQFNKVLTHEYKKMLEAIRSFGGGDYKPKVTFIIVQKRHHTRFELFYWF